jgi:hypothetical protein
MEKEDDYIILFNNNYHNNFSSFFFKAIENLGTIFARSQSNIIFFNCIVFN